MARPIKMHFYTSLALVISTLLSGCWPKDCFGQLAELKSAKANFEKASMTDEGEGRDGGRRSRTGGGGGGGGGSASTGPSMTPVCTEFVTMRREPDKLLIFVDKSAKGANSGESWHDALTSVGAAVKKAMDFHQSQLAQGQPLKMAFIIIASGTYDLDHERAARNIALGNAPIISIDEGAPAMHANMEIRGNYKPGDDCLEIDKNIQARPSMAAGRETVLDGQGASNHVADVSDADHIKFMDLVITGGKALENAAGQAFKKMGGAMVIRGNSHHIELTNVTLKDSEAADKGGCLAIIDNGHHITLNGLTVGRNGQGCTSVNGGGGVFIGDNTHTISADRFMVEHSQATGANSEGGGLLIADWAGHIGPNWNMEFKHVHLNNNQAGLRGGGLSIKNNAHKIKFERFDIYSNEVTQPQGQGGGVAITSQGASGVMFNLGLAGPASSIYNNSAPFQGGGVYVANTGALLAAGTPKFLFNIVNIVSNKISGDYVNARGAGLYAENTGNIYLNNSELRDNELSHNGNGAGLALFGAVRYVTVNSVEILMNRIEGQPRDGSGVWMKNDGLVNRPTDIVFENNTHISGNKGGKNGGGIYASGVKNLRLVNLYFEENFVIQNGGGLFVVDTNLDTLSNTAFVNNRARLNGGAIYALGIKNDAMNFPAPMPMVSITCLTNTAALNGGCAYISKATNTEIAGGNFINNGAAKNDIDFPVDATKRGGAVYYASDSVAGGNDANAKLVLRSVFVGGNGPEFAGNQAQASGGGLYTKDVFDIELNKTQFSANKSNQGGGIYSDFSRYGAASSNTHHQGAKLIIREKNDFVANVSRGDGAAIYASRCLHTFATQNLNDHPDRVYFRNNRAQGHGGAVYAEFCNTNNTLVDLPQFTLFDRNQAGVNPDGSVANNTRQGGAMYFAESPKTVSMGAIFTNNVAQNGGGALMFAGGIPIENFRLIDLTGILSTFTNNSTVNGNGGAVLVDNTVQINNTHLNSFQSSFTENKAPNGRGGAVAFMGLFGNANIHPFTTRLASFSRNEAQADPAIHLQNPPQAGLQFYGTRFTDNKRLAAGNGGLMDLSGVTIERLIFDQAGFGDVTRGSITVSPAVQQNAQHGGAFAVNIINTELRIKDQNIEGFIARDDGGFLRITAPGPNMDITIENSRFEKNQALDSSNSNKGGGVISTLGGLRNINIARTDFNGNIAQQSDGGVFDIPNVHDLVITDSTFRNNEAQDGYGGALAIQQANSVSMTSANPNLLQNMMEGMIDRYSGHSDANIFLPGVNSGNKSHKNGGLFYFVNILTDFTIDNQFFAHNQTDITNNTHPGSGGIIAIDNIAGNFSARNNLMYKNKAALHGGAIYINNAAQSVTFENFNKDSFHPFYLGDLDPIFQTIRNTAKINPVTSWIGMLASYISGEIASGAFYNLPTAHGGFYANGTDIRYRGEFLIDQNTAQTGNGGAMYIGAARDVTIARMPFRSNVAAQGNGGVLFIDNLRGSFTFQDSIAFDGAARDNAGCIFVRGANLPGALGSIDISNSSIQNCQVINGAATGGSAGVYLERLNSVAIRNSNFFANRVLATLGGQWAGALKFNDRANPVLPPVNPAYVAGQDFINNFGAVVNFPLASMVDSVPFMFFGPIQLEDNQVPAGPNNTGTMSIPHALKNVVQYFTYNTPLPALAPNQTPFAINNNAPSPVDALPGNVVLGH